MSYDVALDCWIALVEWMPCHIKGFVMLSDDGQYFMFVDAHLSEAERMKVYEHEREHIVNGDLHSDLPACLIEKALKYMLERKR